MQIIDTALEAVKILDPTVFGDDRGFFMESWNREDFEKRGLPGSFVQDNHSRSSQGVLRGLHYQIKNPQGKLVRVTRGEVFDVAVDMRKSSPQFGQWVGVMLSEMGAGRVCSRILRGVRIRGFPVQMHQLLRTGIRTQSAVE